MDIEKHIEHWTSLCEKNTNEVWCPITWKGVINKPVHETIKELDSEMVIEMALPLKEFRKRVDRLRFQLIENWCLCKYCSLFSPENDNFGHWITEFNSCAKNLRDFEIKGHIDKQKTLKKILIDEYDYNQPRKILTIIREKFDEEKINDPKIRTTVSTGFSESINVLIDFLVDTNISIAEYVKTNFNFQR